MATSDDIKVAIANLKAEKEFIKRSGEEAIAKIEARIAALQSAAALVTSTVEGAIDLLRREDVL